MGIFNVMADRGRPPKDPEDRKTSDIKIPLTDEEKELIKSAAGIDDTKPVTWARNILIRAAKYRVKNNGPVAS